MIAITGATGKLGQLVVAALLAKVPAKDIAVLVRSPEKAAALAAQGVSVRQADYRNPQSLAQALQGVSKLLLISSNEVGQRLAQHQAVVAAAKAAGVKLLAYTSLLHADTSPLLLAAEHRGTEAAIRKSGIPFVFLRNGWYTENYTENFASALTHGVLIGSAQEGKIAAATRADYAAAAAAVLSEAGHENKVYELAGDAPFTMTELAKELSARAGKTIPYQDLPPEQYRSILLGAGLPAPYAEIFVDADIGITKGALHDESHDLQRLIGRTTTPLAVSVAAAF
jgi:NAD(P)H dehydrogenase (quinone)